MIKIGQFNPLKVVKEVSFGLFLDGEDWGEILLPKKVVPQHTKVNDILDVFIYFDSQDKIIATTLRPLATAGSFSFLKVVDVNRIGAFLDWGLDKDLLVPISQQPRRMEKGKFYIVYVTQDTQGRLIASAKLDQFLDKLPIHFKPEDEVNVLIAEKTDLGNKVIINEMHWGLIHSSDIFQTLRYGARMQAYIKTIRDDRKIDVVLRKMGQDSIQQLAMRIMTALRQEGGFLPLHDKSSPLDIQRAFGDSKKSFKNAIGYLYKQGEIRIEANGICLR